MGDHDPQWSTRDPYVGPALSRRQLLKLASVASISSVVAACMPSTPQTLVVAEQPSPLPSAMNIATATNTPTSPATETPSPPPRPTVTITEVPRASETPTPPEMVKPSEWATKNGKVDARIMYPLATSINHANRKAVDLEYAGMKLAVVGDLVTAEIKDVSGYKKSVADGVNDNRDLVRQLDSLVNGVRKQWGEGSVGDARVAIAVGNALAIAKVRDGQITRYTLNENGDLAQMAKEMEPQLLPRLEVVGNRIQRADTKEDVILKGLNVTDLADDDPGSLDAIYRRGLRTVTDQGWPINIFRVALNTDTLDRDQAELDRLIDYAQQHGIYMWLSPHREGANKQPFLPSFKTVGMMQKLARRYSKHTNIMYAILNEPSPANVYFQQTGNWNTPAEQGFRLWMEKAQPVAEAIRNNASDAIVVVGGSDHAASQMSFYLQNPFTIKGSPKGIIYDMHDYGAVDNPNGQVEAGAVSRRQSQLAFIQQNKFPVVYGEFGGTVIEKKILEIPEQDTAYMRRIVDRVNTDIAGQPGHLHYVAWALDPWGDSGVFYPAESGKLSPRGKLILSDLQTHPPTLFSD